MSNRVFALVMGIALLGIGILGFIPGTLTHIFNPLMARQLGVDPETRLLVRCIPVSTAVNIVHIALGAAGILMAASLAGSVRYAQGLCAACFLMVLIGLLPDGAHSVWDVAPLTGGEMAFNLIFVTMAFYFGWVHTHRYIPAAQQTQAGPE